MPIALLLGTATIYPRLGAGARTAWALTIGPFGVAMGASEAGYYTLATSASGDDLPGLLTITAGLTLIAIGTITLRTTRRMETAWPVATYADCCWHQAALLRPICCCPAAAAVWVSGALAQQEVERRVVEGLGVLVQPGV